MHNTIPQQPQDARGFRKLLSNQLHRKSTVSAGIYGCYCNIPRQVTPDACMKQTYKQKKYIYFSN